MSPRHFTRWPAAEGYASRQSVVAGDPSTCIVRAACRRSTIEVARLGRRPRGRAGARRPPIGDHPVPDDAWRAGCDWPVERDASRPTRRGAPGLYEIELRTARRTAGCLTGVRRGTPSGPGPSHDLLHLGTNTWQAYNQWGGKCLYSGATEVSFRRPLEIGYITRPVDDDGYDLRVANIGEYDPEHHRFAQYLAEHEIPLWTGSAGWFNWERRLAEWADREGIELDYSVDADLEADPSVLDGRRLLLTAGHNEYWSWGMRDAVDRFVEAGGNWAILSGNTSFWQVRYSAGRRR